MGSLGPWEIALIVLVVLLVFGPKRLPGIGRSLGRGMREFKDSVGETAKELKEATADTPAALREGFNPKQQLKDALNPFADEKPAEDEKPADEVLEGEVVPSQAPVTPADAHAEPAPVGMEEPAATAPERS